MFSSLVHPSESIPQFITNLTGITNEMAKHAPEPQSVLPRFIEFIGDNVLVGHNAASFDMNFVYDACEKCDLILKNDFIDTLRISKKLHPELAHHRLCDLVKFYSVQQDTAHRAEADAVATVQCFEAMRAEVWKMSEPESPEKYLKKLFSSHKSNDYQKRLKEVSATVTEIDETNPIYGKTVVFTGAMFNMPRSQAFQVVKNLGGEPENTLTKRTNVLVIGRGVIRDWIPQIEKEKNELNQTEKSSKIKKAERYLKDGQDIIIISEDTFFEMIDYKPKRN